jgi:RNA polymerase sigma-70 factor (ECF subfamily)
MTQQSDLVAAARGGDQEAFMSLVRNETREALRLSFDILRNQHDAEDALQEAFVRSWRSLAQLRDADRWTAWFRRIVVSCAIDLSRKRKARSVAWLEREEPDPLGDSAATIGRRDEILRAMDCLDVADHALLVLRFGHDMELPDVAEALHIPLGTAKSRLHRALRRMRAELEKSDDGYRRATPPEAPRKLGPDRG